MFVERYNRHYHIAANALYFSFCSNENKNTRFIRRRTYCFDGFGTFNHSAPSVPSCNYFRQFLLPNTRDATAFLQLLRRISAAQLF